MYYSTMDGYYIYSTRGYYRPVGYYGYCAVPTGTTVVPTDTTVLRVLRYYKLILPSTHGYYVVPKTGYYGTTSLRSTRYGQG